ncbi:MAG TPA: RnfABCDGE type electron transport complex subunit A [Erysipelothrix sp.]|jgi:electron transport complex protein RnfA|nr:RnfABCDGE type electron transport complex subunit A [Erysipelothrix sp.]
MADLLTIAFAAIFIENVVLTKFLGMCPLMGVSRNLKSAIGMSLAVLFVIVGSSILTWAVYEYILDTALNLQYMDLLVFILIIAAFVQFTELFIKKSSPSLYKSLGIFLPLITTNCVVLYVALENIVNGFNFVEMLVYSTAVSLGFMLILVIFASIRERLDSSATPKAFFGSPIALITLAIMALAFTGLAGII